MRPIVQTLPGDNLWRHIERYSPQTVQYIADPDDTGDYRCFVAVDGHDEFMGLCVVDICRLGFGPLKDQTVACLENILVSKEYRRQGLGSRLLEAALMSAWKSHVAYVWWTVDYANTGAIAFYRANGALFIAEEDPGAEVPERYYTALIPNPGPRQP